MSPRVADHHSVAPCSDGGGMTHREQLVLRPAEEVRMHPPTQAVQVACPPMPRSLDPRNGPTALTLRSPSARPSPASHTWNVWWRTATLLPWVSAQGTPSRLSGRGLSRAPFRYARCIPAKACANVRRRLLPPSLPICLRAS